MSLSAKAWAWYQGGRDPYITLISIYIFMPYVATVMIGNAVKGQSMIAGISFLGGLIAALTAPFLGAAADRMGQRMPPLKLLSLLFAPLVAVLWFAKPDGSGLSITAVLVITMLVSLIFTYSEVLHNALMPFASENCVDEAAMSGMALAVGNVVSVGALVFVLWAFALPGKVTWSLVPAAPLFGLDVAMAEPSRIAALIAAALFVVGVIPMFLYTRDAPPAGMSYWTAFRDGARDLKRLVMSVRQHRDVAVFLGARMLYSDAQIALIVFSGIYAAGVMNWQVLQMTTFGVLMSMFAAVGGLLASFLDRRVGPKRAVQIEIIGTIVGLLTLLTVSPAGMKFVFTVQAGTAPLWNGPVLTTVPELLFVGLGGIVAVFNTAIFASSRTYMTRLMPAGQSGAFFGLYALSSTATVWLGPLVVKSTVSTFQSQQAGNIAIAILMLGGLVVVSMVRDDGTRQKGEQ